VEPEALAALPTVPPSSRCLCGGAIGATGHVSAGAERIALLQCARCRSIYLARAPRARARAGTPVNPVLDPKTAQLILQRLQGA
jgi:hypothetical protein